jgi:hypothetical protein
MRVVLFSDGAQDDGMPFAPPFLHFVEHATGEVILVPASLNQNPRLQACVASSNPR